MPLLTLGGRLHGKSVAYAATSLGANLLNPVFSFYYVKVYLNRFHVSEQWFQLAQVIFMVWNAVNDPLFGCLQDNARFFPAMRSRRHSILYGAPLFVLAFIMVWIPWFDYDAVGGVPPWKSGLQLMFALCFYDALFTFVLLAQCALMAELVTDQIDRVRLVRYSQVASLVGSLSVLICDSASTGLSDYSFFLTVCTGLGLAAGACFVYTGLYAETPYDRQNEIQESSLLESATKVDNTQPVLSVAVALKQTIQIFGQRSFVSFVITNLLQIYHMTFLTNFANIIGEQLIGSSISSSAKSVVYGSLFLVPQLLVIAGAPIVSQVGYFGIIRLSFFIKILCGLLYLVIGFGYSWITAIFFVIECANVNGIFSLFGLCLSDIIDIDKRQFQRSNPLSSMVFGLNALVTKPAVSLAPMVTVAILNRYGYSDDENSSVRASSSGSVSVATPSVANDLSTAMFYTTCLVPICTGLLQLLIWQLYTVRNSHKSSSHLLVTSHTP